MLVQVSFLAVVKLAVTQACQDLAISGNQNPENHRPLTVTPLHSKPAKLYITRVT